MISKLLVTSGICFLSMTSALSAQSSSEMDKANGGPGNTNATVSVVTAPADSVNAMIDPRVPSSLQFLIGLCELKDGVYYLPRTKFAELNEVQQHYVLNSDSLFVIKD